MDELDALRYLIVEPMISPTITWRNSKGEAVPPAYNATIRAITMCKHEWVNAGGKVAWCKRCEAAGEYDAMSNITRLSVKDL